MQDAFNVTIQGRKVEGIFCFEANDWPCEGSPDTVRQAIENYRDSLIKTVENMNNILKSDVPERTEHLMVDNPYFQVNEVVLTAPDISPEMEKQSISKYLENMIKPPEKKTKDEA